MSRNRRFLLTAVCMVLLVCTLAILASAKDFDDMKNHWSKSFVDYGVEKGYINGYENNTFRPDNTVTRAEFSKMINTAIGLKADKEAEFSDVKKSDWFYSEIGRAVYAGYVSGYENGTFRPNNTITRQEAAVILFRITLPTTQRADLEKYADADDIADWAEEALSAMSAKGFFAGDQFKCVTPKGGLTRGAAAKLIYQFLENENIYSKNAEAGKNSSKFSETLIVGDVVADEKDVQIVLDNCRVLGNLVVNADDVVVSLHGTVINAIENNAHGTEITADENCEIKNGVTMNAEGELSGDTFGTVYLTGEKLSEGSVDLSGNFEKVVVSVSTVVKAEDGKIDTFEVSDGINLIIQKGDIETLEVKSSAKNAVINLVSGVKVAKANVNAACTFMGKGTIDTAYNAVTGVKYETIPENVTGKGAEDSEGNAVGKMDDPTVSPADEKENVSRGTSVTISFAKNIYNKSGNTVTSSYITSNVKLRKGSKSGSAVSCEATISSSRRITLEPVNTLEADTTYYVTITEGAFVDVDGNTNEAFTSSFTTDDDAVTTSGTVTITPENADTGVELDSTVKIVFSEAMYRPNGSTLTESYLKTSAIELRKGSASGTELDYSATISSNRTITITPEKNFEANTRYYVIILAGSLANSKGDTVAKKTSYFTTENTLLPTVTPGNAETGVSTLTDITIEFDKAVTTMSGGNVTQSYIIANVAEIRKSKTTGTSIDFSARISSDKKTITLTPYEELDKGTRYYVIVNDSTLKTSAGAVNEKVSVYFTTAAQMAPIVTPGNAKTGISSDTDVTIDFGEAIYTSSSTSSRKAVTADYIKDNEIITLRRNSSTGTVVSCNIDVDSSDGVIVLTPKAELVENAKYYVVVKSGKIYNSSGRSNSSTTTYFTIGKSLVPEITPYDGETGVEVDDTITVEFSEDVYTTDEEELTNAYIADKFEIRKGSETGTKVDFTAKLNTSNKRIITLTPSEDLDGNTKYYVILLSGSVINDDGVVNSKVVSMFTTETSSAKKVVITPEDRATDVSVSTEIKIEFASEIYKYSKSGAGELTQEYAEENIFLRKRSASSGNEVDAKLVISNGNKTFTFVPKEALDTSTRYYIVINGSKFQYADDTVVSSKTVYFTTGSGVPVVSAFNLESAGATSAVFTVTSDTTGTLTLTATPKSGSAVTNSVSVTAGVTKTVTLSGLKPETKYTVKAQVKSAAGKESVAKSVDVVTTNAFDSDITEVTDSGAVLTVNAYSAGKLTVTYKNVETGKTETVITNSIISAGKTKNVEISGLVPGTDYEITAKFQCDGVGEEPITVTETITTEEAVDYLAISKILLSDSEDNAYEAELDGTSAIASIESTTSVKINVSGVTGAKITVDGKAVENGKYGDAIEVTPGEDKTIEIVVTHGENSRTYQLTVSVGE